LTREEAKKWFEAALAGELPTGNKIRPAYEAAFEALSQPKFIALREGEIAVIEVDHHLDAAAMQRFREQWQAYTNTRVVVLEKTRLPERTQVGGGRHFGTHRNPNPHAAGKGTLISGPKPSTIQVMTLDDYLADRRRAPTLQHFASRAGISRQTLHRARRGLPLGKRAAKKISAATNGEVSVVELLGLELSSPLRDPSAEKAVGTR